MRIKVEEEAIFKVKGGKVKVDLVEDVYEWTLCCYGEACVIKPRVVVEEVDDVKGLVKLGEDRGVEVYARPNLADKLDEELTICVNEEGELVAKGLRTEISFNVKQAPTL